MSAIKFSPVLLVLGVMSTSAATHYVDPKSAGPTPPYTNWTTAATTIQEAVDAAVVGDQILVTNGTYALGGLGTVSVNQPLSLSSLNGPEFTVIDGGGTVGCVYLTGGASLSGFTLTNGFARIGGGVYCESASAVVSNCVLTGNSAYSGFKASGGGAAYGTLNNCTLTGNSAPGGYWASSGGGAYGCTLNNCTLSRNSASYGGGAYGGSLNNCTLSGNSGHEGGGASHGMLNNCTLTGNYAAYGGGASHATLNNCIVCFNTANQGANYAPGLDAAPGITLNYCCTTPLPPDGIGNISLDPQLASASHLSAASPCRGAGSAAYLTSTDIDGELWANPPSIGCDENHAGSLTGALSVAIVAALTNVTVGYTVGLTALIEGRTAGSVWDFGDGIAATNQPYTSHAWTAIGDYAVISRAYNESQPGGISATVTVHVARYVHYVAPDSDSPLAPYTSWATAATNIQDAVDAASVPGALVLATNGIYAPVAVDKLLSLRSVNGPRFTVIDGGHATRCVTLINGTSLYGFTLTNGYANGDAGGGVCGGTVNNCTLRSNSASIGGGAYYSTLNNCTLSGNSAGGRGGGTYECTLNNCTLSGNSANEGGGGANSCTLNNCALTSNSAGGGGASGGAALQCMLNNCTVSGNSASYGGGGSQCVLNDCIVYFNTAPSGANYDGSYGDYSSALNYCCTTPLPINGVGNIAQAPLFVNQASGNLRLQSSSPCINSGFNGYAPAALDLDGSLRIVGGTVDIGAYEFQSPASVISYTWLQQYGLPSDGSADYLDSDGDGMNNWQEWRCGTNPTNALSALRLLPAFPTGTNVTVTWQSVAGMIYFLHRTMNLSAPVLFTPVATSIPGQPGTTAYTDTNATGPGPFFYRVGVSSP